MSIRISAELSHICPLKEIAKHADALESNGFYRVWVPDTIVSPWEAWLAASVIMYRTQRLQIGLGVINPYTRHAVVMAQMAATLQHLSGGRLTLSIGKGISRFLDKAGIKQHDTAVEECTIIIRRLLSGERLSIAGKAYHIDGIRLRTQSPNTPVPIFHAAIGHASWEIAMRTADGIATVWSDQLPEIRRRCMDERTLPTVVLIPFAQSHPDFFAKSVTSVDELKARVDKLETSGFDEVMVAYAEMKDLETAARVLIHTAF